MIAPFLIAALLIELTPGPNMTWLAMLGASRGSAAALAAVAGIAVGLAIAGLAAALGLTAIFSATPWLLDVLRWAGAAYLLWLAYDAWRGAEATAAAALDEPVGRYFAQGLITNILNPKAYLFYVTVTPEFIVPDRPLLPQLLALAAGYVAVATAVHAAIALVAGRASRLLAPPGRNRAIRRIFAALLVLVAGWFLVSTRGTA